MHQREGMSGKIEVRQWAKRLRFAPSWPVEDFAQGNRVQDLEVDTWRLRRRLGRQGHLVEYGDLLPGQSFAGPGAG